MNTPLRIVIPGGSGQVGTILARHFHAQGHAVTVFARHPVARPWRTVVWDAENIGSWTGELEGSDALINLAGRSVNCRYNAANRMAIKESRVRTTRLLGRAVAEAANPPAIWMNASTATIYRHAMDRAMDERTGELGGNELEVPSTWRFSIDVARSWETAFFETSTPRTRKIALRSAMIMSPDKSGVFDTLLQLVRVGLGGTAGSGRQYVSWIHDADFAKAIDFLITQNHIDGVVNVSSPNPLPNREFMRILREAWGIRIGMPAPGWVLEIGAIGLRTETELLLKSRRVVPGRLLDSGFAFGFPDWSAAARNLVSRSRSIGSHRY
jgi:uncharacterized protein